MSIAAGSEVYGTGVPVSFTDGSNPGLLSLGSVSSDADLSYEMFTAYSDTALYLGFRVRDDFIDNNDTNPILNDEIELFIDGDRVANDFIPPDRTGNAEGFQLAADTVGHQFTQGTGLSNADWSVATSTFPGGYNIEFAIPLSMIDTQDGPGVTPAGPGSNLRINVGINDNDRVTSSQDTYGTLWLNPGVISPFHEGEPSWVVDLYLDNGTPPNSTAPLLITAPHRSTGMLLDGSIGSGASGNIVQGNLIGTSQDGTGSLGNGGDGVRISDNAQNNQVGGVGNGEANVIAYNSGNGVTVVGDLSTGNIIRGNALRDNNGLGIDLGDDGVTPNHSGGPITGPNGLTNFPTIIAARPGPSTHIVGSYAGAPDALITIDLYASPAPDPSGYGEGQRFLGFVVVFTDDAGNADFAVDLDDIQPW